MEELLKKLGKMNYYVKNIDEELSAICSIESFDGATLAKYLDDMFC